MIVIGLIFIMVSPKNVLCDQTYENPADSGVFYDNIYINGYFNIKLSVPKGWHILNQQQNKAFKGLSEHIAEENGERKGSYKSQVERMVTLVTAFKYPIPKTDGYNPSFSCIAESLEYYPEIKNGKELLEKVRKVENRGTIEYSYPNPISRVEINGVIFYGLKMLAKTNDFSIKQEFFTTTLNGYLLKFLFTYEEEKDLEIYKNIIKSIEF